LNAGTVVAPGKIVLLGEYAVLDGAPSVVAAVDRGVQCRFELGGEALRLHTPGDDRFARAALVAVQAPPGRYRFAAHNPSGTATKAGLGSSAAATVAAVVAGRAARGLAGDPDAACALATSVHRVVQGSGSGIDVAASSHGGVLRFEQGRIQSLQPVHPVVVWSGLSAATGPRVHQYLAWSDREAFVADSRAAVELFDSRPLDAIRQATAALDRMARDAAIAYWTPSLRAIVALAAELGGAAKPSGAGGGDCAIALFEHPDLAAAFRQRCAAAGTPPIEVNLAPGAGVVVC
jgi:phosphomevalonate kinase